MVSASLNQKPRMISFAAIFTKRDFAIYSGRNASKVGAMKTNKTKIDSSIHGWFRALRAVDTMYQSWVCIGWFRTRSEAEIALSK